jgi:ribosomal protein S18 acetylase RimI-like enzyme
MPGPEIVAFSDEHLDAAAELLRQRHECHRAAEPLLPADVDFPALVGELWAKEEASGAAGIRNGRVTSYVVGTRLDDDVWGPNAWVELAGHAAEEPEDVRDLYGFAAARWVEDGRRSHYVYVPASGNGLVDAWFRVGFGAQHAFGIRELTDEPAREVPGVVVREADERDLDAMSAVAPTLKEHQSLSPVFSKGRSWSDEEMRADILRDLGDETVGNLVAEIDGQVVANFVVAPIELTSAHYGVARPPGASLLGFAATLPEARGSGAGLALTSACFAWARERGYEVMVTDWRVTNLLSSRFWPKRGFRPTFLRLHRYIA